MSKRKMPPNQNKYSFSKLKLNKPVTKKGDYRLIRVAARTYARKHNQLILVQERNGIIKVERYK